MGLNRYFRALESELSAAVNAHLFTEARLRLPALATHETLSSAMEVLADRSRDRNRDKDAITRALIAEYRESKKSYWLAAILVAYAPMMRRLRRGCCGNDIPPDELDQLMITKLIDTIDTCPLDRAWLCRELCRCTRRHVFKYLNTENAMRRLVCSVAPDQLAYDEATEAMLMASDSAESVHGSAAAAIGRDPEERAICIAYLRDRAGDALDSEKLDLVIATRIDGERLTRYVARHYPASSNTERRRVYQRIKRRHSRAMAKLRKVFAGEWQRVRLARAAQDERSCLSMAA